MNASTFTLRFILLNLLFSATIAGALAQGVINLSQGSASAAFAAPATPPIRLTSPQSESPTAPQSSNCITPPVGLVGWWKGDGNTLDSVSANNGVNQNVAYTSGVVGQAFAFDPENFTYGTYTGIQIADQPAYALTNALTIEGWIRPRGDSYMIFWRGDHRPGLDPYYLSMQGNNTLRFGICDANGNGAFVDTTLNYSVWTHVAASLDGGSGTLSIYTNGILAAQTHTNIRPFEYLPADQSPGIGIGNVNDGGNNFPFIGDVDEISLYARALSMGEIQAIYNAGSAGKCSATTSTNDCVAPPAGLVSWWKGEGNANDSIGNLTGAWLNYADYTNGEVGEGFRFGGSSRQQSMDISYSPALIHTNYSVEAWINPQAEPNNEINQDWIFGQCYGTAQMVVRTGTSGVYVAFQFSSGGKYGPFNTVVSTGEIPLNQFTHVVGTWDGVALKLYINGVLNNSSPVAAVPVDTGCDFYIGGVYHQASDACDYVGQFFTGIIDEVSLYNRALSSGEITAIYNAGSAGKCTVMTNDCVASPSGLAGWWKGDGNALDNIGANNGTLMGGGSYVAAEVGQGFQLANYGDYIDIPASASLNVAAGGDFTLESWINPSTLSAQQPIFDWKKDSIEHGAHFYISVPADSGNLYVNLVDINNTSHVAVTTNGIVKTGTYQHVAVTYAKTTGVCNIYYNGVIVSTANLGNFTPKTTTGLCLGERADDGSSTEHFIGVIDEASIYSRALSADEIAAIYTAGNAGKCTENTTNNGVTPPSGIISWWKGERNILDSVGNNNGIVTEGSVGYAPAEVGFGFNFDGGANRILVSNTPALNFGAGQNFSIEGWISPLMPPPDLSYGVMTIVDKREAPNISQCLGYEFSLVNGQLNVRLSDSISGIGDNWIGGPDLRDGKMHHVALTIERDSTHGGNLYVDGVSVLQFDPTSQSGDLSNTGPLRIGNHPDSSFNSFFNGRIDEISIYNRALSSNEIAAIYNAGSAGKCTSTLVQSCTAPQIFNLTPAVATNGALVTISGTNFNSNGADNIVYFGAVQANVISATPTSLVVKVPVGATYAPVTVTAGGLTAYSSQLFEPTFLGDGSAISSASFGSRLDLPVGNGPVKVVIADLDGDGKPDLIVANVFGNTISLYRNISTQGALTTDSFAPRVDLVTTTGQYNPFSVAAADIDGDGKLDIIVSGYDNSIVSVFRNTCTPGNINSNTFSARVDFACGFQPQDFEVKDVDGDGRPDIVTANRGDGTISILRNIGETGSISTNSFASHIDISTGSSCDGVVIGDLDGDGKPDIAVANTDDGTVSVLRNLSSPGSLSADSFAPKVDTLVSSPLIRMTLGDVDGDGKSDLVVAASGPQAVYVLRNTSVTGNLSFASPVGFSLAGWGHNPILSDLDGDGKLDLAVVTELNSTLSVFQNIGATGSFDSNSLASRIDFGTGWNAWGVAAGDLDGDGRPDLVFCNNYDSTISIYQNQAPLSLNTQHNPPIITSQPLSQAVLQGSSATFSTTATGSGPLTYQWKFNKANIAKATNAMLTLTNLHPAQAGNYTVTVSNPYGSVTSSNAALTVTAQNVLIYTYSGNEKVTTAKQEFSYNYSGQMFFIPGSTNGVFIGWATISGKKQYWVSAFSDYLLATIPGAANHTYTVLGKAGNDVDANGQPHIWSYLHKGQNTTLTIANKKTFSFPGTFACNDSHVYPDPQTGKMILREATSTYTYATQTTVSANNNGQTLADLINALTQSLAKQGYKPQ